MLLETSRDLARLKEDLGWRQLGTSEASAVQDLPLLRTLCRNAFQQTNSFVKDAVLLLTAFAFSQGVQCPSSKDEATQAILARYWDEPSNRQSAFGQLTQLRRSNQLLLDGSLFYLHRVLGSEVRVRYVSVGQVKEIIADPEDGARVLGYRLEVSRPRWDGQRLVADGAPTALYYRDIENTLPTADPLEGKVPWERDAYLLHAAINQLDDTGWGVPEPAASLKWYRLAKDLMEDQAAISAASARLMNILAVSAEGDPAAVKSLLEEMGQDALGNEFSAGGINVMSPTLTLTQQRASTGAADAHLNGRELRMGGAAGMGLPLHYLADPENANLATAESIERPVLERLQTYQLVWMDTFFRSCRLACAVAGKPQAEFDVQMPNIMQVNITGSDVTQAADAGYITRKRAATWWLDALNVDNPEQELEELEREWNRSPAADQDAELVEEEGESEW